MLTKFIEATNGSEFNWGKFCVGRFGIDEWACPSVVGNEPSLLCSRGWTHNHILVFDLQTGEGAYFMPGGCAKADLEKHKIDVCPMFEPFLEWLYQQNLKDLQLLPSFVDLGPEADKHASMSGYRRPGSTA